ncbi:unnamed protein product [Caenorhabditis brenneri]
MGNTQTTPEKDSIGKVSKNRADSSTSPSNSTSAEESAAERLARLQTTATSLHQEMLVALDVLPLQEQAQACQSMIPHLAAALKDFEEPILRAQAAERQKQQELEAMAHNKGMTQEDKTRALLDHQKWLATIAKLPADEKEEGLKNAALHVLLLDGEYLEVPNNSSRSNAADPDVAIKLLCDGYDSDEEGNYERTISSIAKILKRKLQDPKNKMQGEGQEETEEIMQNTPSTSGPPPKKSRMSLERD